MSRIPVVVTGIGATTPSAATRRRTWDGAAGGRSGVSRIEADWADDMPVKIAGAGRRRPDRGAGAGRGPSAGPLAPSSRVVAAMEAWEDAGYGLKEDNPVDRDRLGVAIGTGIGGLHTLLGQWDIQKEKGARRVSPLAIPMLMANASAANIGLRLGARAGVHTPVSACASSNESISLGLDMIRLGRADVVVVGGTEACIHPMPMACFAPDAGDEPPQRRARARLAALGRRPGRVRARRGCRDLRDRDPRRTPRRAEPGSTASWPAPASPPTPTTWSSPTRAATTQARRDDERAARGRAGRRPTSCTSTPTPPPRRRATSTEVALDPAGARRGHRGDRHRHQVDDRAPARRRRRAGVAWPPCWPCATARCRRRSTSTTPSPTSASTSPPRCATCPAGDLAGDQQLVRLRRSQRRGRLHQPVRHRS